MDAKKIVALRNSQSLRQRAGQQMEKGAVTSGFAGHRNAVIRLLNEALAAELANVLRDRTSPLSTGTLSDPIRVRSGQETIHLDRLAKLIIDLGGEPNYAPDEVRHTRFGNGDQRHRPCR